MSAAIQTERRGPRHAERAQAGGAAPGVETPKAAVEAEGAKPEAGKREQEPLSTERLQRSLQATLRGEAEAAQPAEETSTGAGAEATAPEAGVEGEPSTTPGEGGAAEDTAETPAGLDQSQKGLIDAVTALRAERRELRAELEQMKGKLETIAAAKEKEEPASPATSEPDPVAYDPEVAQVLAAEQDQRELVGWARQQLRTVERAPEQVVAELKRRKIELGTEEPEALKDMLETVRENGQAKLDELIVERRAVISVARQRGKETQAASSQVADTVLPERKDASSDRAKLFQHVLKNNPGLKLVPDGEFRAALQVLGIEQAMAVIRAGGQDPIKVLKFEKLGLKAPSGAAKTAAAARAATSGKVAHQVPTTRLPGAPVNAPGGTGQGSEPSSHELYLRYQATGKEEDKRAWMRATLK
jgi:hypothetical protein